MYVMILSQSYYLVPSDWGQPLKKIKPKAIINDKALGKPNDGNPLHHNNKVFCFIFIIFIQVVNDAAPCCKQSICLPNCQFIQKMNII